MHSWLCSTSYGRGTTWSWWHWCLSWWYWCLFFHLGTPYFTTWQNTTSDGSQWFHCQPPQIQMSHSGNWSAWILAHTHWFKTMKQKMMASYIPKKLSQMHGFLGAVYHDCCMWPQHSHILAPLSSESGRKTFCWTDKMDLAFKYMQAAMPQDNLFACCNNKKPFYIYTNASDYHMGAYIVQDNKPVAFLSCKLNGI